MDYRDQIPGPLMGVLHQLPDSFLVGGCVRDLLLGRKPKDYDVEVFKTTYPALAKQLEKFGRVDLVGQSFGVIKLSMGGEVYDFAIPRKEAPLTADMVGALAFGLAAVVKGEELVLLHPEKDTPERRSAREQAFEQVKKLNNAHKAFAVEHPPDITMEEAAKRRDFTINAMFLDPRTGRIIDFYGGQRDIQARVLRHTSPAFVEDPLRVLRAMQFASRFDFTVAPETTQLCRDIKETFHGITKPRIWMEWAKWGAQAQRPSRGLQFLVQSTWVEHFPELAAIIGVPQDPRHHPEGDVFAHTCHMVDALVQLPEWKNADTLHRIILSFGGLTHDLGKPSKTVIQPDGRIISHGHEDAGVPVAESFLRSIDAPNQVREEVLPLVRYHMVRNPNPNASAVRRLALKVAPSNLQSLFVIMTADHFGRPPLPRVISPDQLKMEEIARELKVAAQAPKRILLGRHLIERGMQPGQHFGPMLDQAFEAQLNGEFSNEEDGRKWLDDFFARNNQPDNSIT